VVNAGSGLCDPARRAAIANGTLIVDHATPVDHAPNETGRAPADAIAIPILAGRRLDNS
ncbi:MAG: hypothetical protein QOJ61_3940, partial [Mycobacterium sp.]|nr:hypothetical protein [Mycobacterium sp.]